MTSLNTRKSNIELLRVLAMLMIIAFHIFHYCVDFQLTDEDSMELLGNGLFNTPEFYPRLLLLAVLSPLGKAGNAIFLLISGYFMFPQEHTDLLKVSKKLFLQLLFAVLVLMLGSYLVFRHTGGIHDGVITYVVDFSMFNKSDWFIGYYFAVVVIGGLFLNQRLKAMGQRGWLTFLIVLFAFVEFEWTNQMAASLADGLQILCTGVFLYSLGGYLRIHHPFDRVRLWVFIVVILAAFALVFVSAYGITQRNIQTWLLDEETDPFIQEIPAYKDSSLIPIVIGICLFELFRRVRLPRSRIINFMGASTLMVYLIHDNYFFRNLWKAQDWITPLHDSVGTFVLEYLKWVFGIFLLGAAAYGVYCIFGWILPKCRGIVLKGNAAVSEKTDS